MDRNIIRKWINADIISHTSGYNEIQLSTNNIKPTSAQVSDHWSRINIFEFISNRNMISLSSNFSLSLLQKYCWCIIFTNCHVIVIPYRSLLYRLRRPYHNILYHVPYVIIDIEDYVSNLLFTRTDVWVVVFIWSHSFSELSTGTSIWPTLVWNIRYSIEMANSPEFILELLSKTLY